MSDIPKIAVIIVAAGRGSRAGTSGPKQYEYLHGKTILDHTVTSISSFISSALILPVIHSDDAALFNNCSETNNTLPPVIGGTTRQQSVYEGLKTLKDHAPDYVLIHDAARPFVSKAILKNLIAKLNDGHKAVIPAVAVVNTLKRISEDNTETICRDNLFSVQTPQAFSFPEILQAHTNAPHNNFTDDAAVYEHFNGKIELIDGEEKNFKITNPTDFKKAENLMMAQLADIRVGSGYDVHRFDTGDHLWLAGIKIPFTKSLKGHSDADVALHALTDAILAAISEGDIGTHFPPTDEKWRGVASHVFLEHAKDLVAQKGGIISHITVCIICEKPKIGPHKENMREHIANLLSISIDRVSVQATTTEKLGFTGREEGIAAQATATIRLPLEI